VRSEILEKHPHARMSVYAIWFRNIWSDARFLWPSNALDDSRVANFWDSDKVAGTWYAANVTRQGRRIEWDAWILYPPGKRFSEPPLAWGRTIIDSRERLRAELDKFLAVP
jgi:hypothetical protein